MYARMMLADLTGQIETITYTNPENGFTIARVKVPGERQLITVVGNLMAPTPGEVLKMEGEWSLHPKYGRQFKVMHCRSEVPASLHGIRKYLGSGLIKGLGPVMADRIVKKFGPDTLDIIENELGPSSESVSRTYMIPASTLISEFLGIPIFSAIRSADIKPIPKISEARR